MLRDSKGRFLSCRLAEEKKELEALKDQIEIRLQAIDESGIGVPEIVREVVKSVLMPIVRQFGFSPEDLEIIQPTPKDPMVTYKGEIVCWYLKI